MVVGVCTLLMDRLPLSPFFLHALTHIHTPSTHTQPPSPEEEEEDDAFAAWAHAEQAEDARALLPVKARVDDERALETPDSGAYAHACVYFCMFGCVGSSSRRGQSPATSQGTGGGRAGAGGTGFGCVLYVYVCLGVQTQYTLPPPHVHIHPPRLFSRSHSPPNI